MRYVSILAAWEVVLWLRMFSRWGRFFDAPPHVPEPESDGLAFDARHKRTDDGRRYGWSLPEFLAYGCTPHISSEAVEVVRAVHQNGGCGVQFTLAQSDLPPYGEPPMEHHED